MSIPWSVINLVPRALVRGSNLNFPLSSLPHSLSIPSKSVSLLHIFCFHRYIALHPSPFSFIFTFLLFLNPFLRFTFFFSYLPCIIFHSHSLIFPTFLNSYLFLPFHSSSLLFSIPTSLLCLPFPFLYLPIPSWLLVNCHYCHVGNLTWSLCWVLWCGLN